MKTILFLINGYGVEQKNSYSIYSKDLTPNFDKLMNQNLFSTLDANINNIYEGYRNASLDVNEVYNYSILNREIANENLIKNNTLLDLSNKLNERKSKLHIFCLVDTSEKIVDNLKELLKTINKEKNKKIYYHLVLTSSNIEDYNRILRVLSKINIELSEYGKIGFVMGLGAISNDNPVAEMSFFYRSFISEVGEKWQSFKQKIDVCYGIKERPNLVKPFIVNDGFRLDKDDIFLFWNYDKIDLTNFINMTRNIRYGNESNNILFYSLFQITSQVQVPYIFNYEISEESLYNNLSKLNKKALLITRKSTINTIKYYCNGFKTVNDDVITYMEFDNILYKPNDLINIINTSTQDLIIINYDLSIVDKVDELKEMLHNIDIILGNVYDTFKENNTLIISSLYGINKLLTNSKEEICNINFNSKVPFIYINNLITRKHYLIEPGNVNDILKACYKSISNDYQKTSIVAKKNFLYRLFFGTK